MTGGHAVTSRPSPDGARVRNGLARLVLLALLLLVLVVAAGVSVARSPDPVGTPSAPLEPSVHPDSSPTITSYEEGGDSGTDGPWTLDMENGAGDVLIVDATATELSDGAVVAASDTSGDSFTVLTSNSETGAGNSAADTVDTVVLVATASAGDEVVTVQLAGSGSPSADEMNAIVTSVSGTTTSPLLGTWGDSGDSYTSAISSTSGDFLFGIGAVGVPAGGRTYSGSADYLGEQSNDFGTSFAYGVTSTFTAAGDDSEGLSDADGSQIQFILLDLSQTSGAPPPDAPTDFAIDTLTSTSVTFDWVQSDTPSIVNNTVTVWTGSSCAGTVIGAFSTDGPATTYGVGSLEPAYGYSASVTAWNATEQSGPSNCEDFTMDSPASVTYSNATFVLPDWACWGGYQAKPGGASDCQTPLLSWTQDGVYYVNSERDLTFYSFVNSTAYDMGTWTILPQTIAEYDMIPNLLFITQDGSYVYTWGSAIGDSGAIEVEAENVTTHAQFDYVFSGITTSQIYSNGQVQMTGYDGNDSWLTLVLAGGEVYTHNIWTDTQSATATLSFFEANNLYWIPYLNAYINIEADGSGGDAWEEWQMTAQNGELTDVASGTWGSDVTVNGVSGWSFNVTSRQLSLTIENYAVTFDVNAAGVVTSVASADSSSEDAAYPSLGAVSSNERGSLVANGQSYNIVADPSTDAFLFNPPTDVVYPASSTPYVYVDDSPNPFYGWEQYYDDGTFFNTSYFVSAESFACPFGADGFESACSVNNTAGGYTVGTIWYEWNSALPEFPFPAASPAAQLTYPTPVSTAQESFTSTSVTLDWTVPTENATPLINYTLMWSVNGGAVTGVNLYPTTTTYTLGGLETGAELTYCVEAWNLHWHGSCVEHSWLVGSGFPSAPEFSSITASTAVLAWTQGSFPDDSPVVNDTLLIGTVCGVWTYAISTDGAATTGTSMGLAPGTTYCAAIEMWNATTSETGPTAFFTTIFGGSSGAVGTVTGADILLWIIGISFAGVFIFTLYDRERKRRGGPN